MEYAEFNKLVEAKVAKDVREFVPFKRSFLTSLYDFVLSYFDTTRNDRIVARAAMMGGGFDSNNPEIGDIARLPEFWQKKAFAAHQKSFYTAELFKELTR